MASSDLQLLLRILDERDIALGRDDVAWAFEGSTRDEAQSWVQEYLSPASLLTKEEFIFHDKQPQYSAKESNVTSSGRPLSDNDFETAIASLEASTAAISKQCQLMEAQKEALHALKARHSNDDTIHHAHLHRQKTLAREKAQLDFEVNEFTGALRSRLQTSSKQADGVVAGLPTSVERIFEKDDRLLDGLQKLLPKLAVVNFEGETEQEVELLCHSLVALTSQEVRSRIDAAYQAASARDSSRDHGYDSKAEKQQKALRAELDELSGEIESLATMAVDNQYRLPLMRELKGVKGDNDSDKARWSDYVLAILQYFTTRLETLDDHCHHLFAHKGALTSIAATLDGILATPIPSKQEPPPRSPATPIARGLKPLRLVQANLPEDPTAQLLRIFDIRTADSIDISKLATTLERAVRERQGRLSELGSNTERTVSDMLAETMRQADRDVQDLLGAVYAHSQYAAVGIVDAEVQAGLDGLEKKTQSLGEQMRGLDVDAAAKKAVLR